MSTRNQFRTISLTLLTAIIIAASTQMSFAGSCIVPDNGEGTAALPPAGCEYTSPDEVFMIIDGLPPGTTIEMEGILKNFLPCQNCQICSVPMQPGQIEVPGGTLGGNVHCFSATLDLTVSGTGDMIGFNRQLAIPVDIEMHTGPRNTGDPVQTFESMIFRMQGELFGDPDFCTFRIAGGMDFGLPSPGQTTLTELPSGDFAVDSFFDITYQIEFEGCPGSVLTDLAGTTTATIRMETGAKPCQAKPDGSGCIETECLESGKRCMPVSVVFDPTTGYIRVLQCRCIGPDECFVDLSNVSQDSCTVPDNGAGTVSLPPVGCEYTSPDEVFEIIDGLPPGTTIEMDGVIMNITACSSPCAMCSLLVPPGQTEVPGGTLGGHGHCFEATLDLTVTGTGELAGFNRHLAIPIFSEVHTGPRNPGDPVQTFPADMFRLQGELFGDPDFCTFRIVSGTDFGLPGPGQTTLTKLPNGDFAVDSFFDITYQIEFEGCPGSQLADFAGVNTATITMQTGSEPVMPRCIGDCQTCSFCQESISVNQDGTINISCQCLPDADLNRDGIVDFKDFAIMAAQWLSTRP